MEKLKLKKPIIFFDLETTGTDVSSDKIVEIGLIKLMPNGDTEEKEMIINPGIPIPKEASDVHGITDDKVNGKPFFAQIAKNMAEYFKGCDIGGYNSNRFDVPLLVEEFLRCDINFPEPDTKFVDVFKIFTINEKRTLEAAYKFYCKKTLENAHSAKADIQATMDIFIEQLQYYNDMPKEISAIDDYCREGKEIVDYAGNILKEDNGEYIFAFGKHKGKRVLDNIDYVDWMLKSNFTLNTKQKLKEIINNKN